VRGAHPATRDAKDDLPKASLAHAVEVCLPAPLRTWASRLSSLASRFCC